MTRVLIGSTIPAFKMEPDGHWWHWLENAGEMLFECADHGIEVSWLAVLQHDGRDRALFEPLVEMIEILEAEVRWFSVDPPAGGWTTDNRLAPICIGRNLIVEHALQHGHDHIYFADADISAPPDVLVRLLELGWPVIGAHVPTYCLDGPQTGMRGDTRRHWNTAGSLLVAREAFRRVPWRHDPDAGESDDPATQAELERLGWPTLVRHDVVCRHHPEHVVPLEERGHDLRGHVHGHVPGQNLGQCPQCAWNDVAWNGTYGDSTRLRCNRCGSQWQGIRSG